MAIFSLTHNANVIGADLAVKARDLVVALDNAVGRAATEMADAERLAAPKWRTELANSILAGRRPGAPLEYQVLANSRHGVPVDQGSKGKGWAPVDQIIKWMDAKGIVPRDARMTTLDLARLIRLRIGQRGNKAHPFWKDTADRRAGRLVELARAAVANTLGLPT